MDLASDHLWLAAILVALTCAIVGWRFFRATVRSLRLFVRSLWPH